MTAMLQTDYPGFTFEDFMQEFRLMCDDSWGDTLEAHFAAAGEMNERGLDIPAEWEYRPGLFGGKDPDSYWTDMCEGMSDEDLEKVGRFMFRYARLLKRAGKDY